MLILGKVPLKLVHSGGISTKKEENNKLLHLLKIPRTPDKYESPMRGWQPEGSQDSLALWWNLEQEPSVGTLSRVLSSVTGKTGGLIPTLWQGCPLHDWIRQITSSGEIIKASLKETHWMSIIWIPCKLVIPSRFISWKTSFSDIDRKWNSTKYD